MEVYYCNNNSMKIFPPYNLIYFWHQSKNSTIHKQLLVVVMVTWECLTGPATKYSLFMEITHGSLLSRFRGIFSLILPMKPITKVKILLRLTNAYNYLSLAILNKIMIILQLLGNWHKRKTEKYPNTMDKNAIFQMVIAVDSQLNVRN